MPPSASDGDKPLLDVYRPPQSYQVECQPGSAKSAIDDKLRQFLTSANIGWLPLDAGRCLLAESTWRSIYGKTFLYRPRLRSGSKAEFEFGLQTCSDYLIIPFSADVCGLPIRVTHVRIGGYLCRGFVVSLGSFAMAEFFVSPTDFSWTMIYTHEDYSFGGPFFIRQEWAGQ
jgi:hypothetical protein